MKTRMIFLFALVTAILGACAQGNGGDSKGSEGAQGVYEQLIEGNWKDRCEAWGGGEFSSSSQTLLSFNSTTATFSAQNFGSTDCTGDVTAIIKTTFTFEIPSRSSLGADIFDFNLVLQKVTEVVFKQSVADGFNTIAHCGFTDWAVGVEKDITDKDCLTIGVKAGEKIYSIIKITENQIQFGEHDDAHDGSTPELRPVKLSSLVFSKVQ